MRLHFSSALAKVGGCHRLMLQSQLVLGVISFLSIGRVCFWRAHKLADGFSVTRLETPSLLVKRF